MRRNDIARVLGATCTEKDWPEDFQHENGDYQCHCIGCNGVFRGHKRRVMCKECANPPSTGAKT